MKININKRNIIIILLLSGLVIHDVIKIDSFKFFNVTLTYLRVILLISILLFIFGVSKLKKFDIISKILLIFILYGFTRISGNYRTFLSIYFPLVSFFAIYIFTNQKSTINICITFLSCCLIILCFTGAFEIFTGHHFAETYFAQYYGYTNVKYLATGMYYNENDFSALLTILILYFLMSNFNKYIKIIISLSALSIIICNKSIICLLGLFSFLMIYFISNSRHSTGKIIKIILLIIGLTISSPIIVKIILSQSSFNYRLYMYQYGIRNCFKHLLFGTGIGNYGAGMVSLGFVNNINTSTDPHCLFLELAGQFGLLWSLLLIYIMLKMLFWFAKKSKNKYHILYFGLIYITFFAGLESSTCMDKNYIYLALLFPLLEYYYEKNQTISKPIDDL